MATLSEKAKSRSKTSSSSSTLQKKAKARTGGEVIKATSVEDLEREEGLAPVPHMSDPIPFDKAPPLPPPLSYIRKLATIPSLRRNE